MSFLGSLNPFRAPTATQSPSGQPNGPGAPAPATNQPGQTDPNAGKTPQQVDPLAAFNKMYDNTDTVEQAPQFSLDDKALDGAVAANDFTKGFSPEMMQKATSGDANALMAMMNHVAGQAYKSALSHGATLTGKFSDARETFNAKGLGAKVQRELTVNALTGTPNFKNPVVRKQLTMVADNLQRQHPDSSPEEIASMARDYITELGNAINPSKPESSAGKPGSTNWDSYFDESSDQ